MSWSHGGDIYALDRQILDFSSNLNPRGMPDCAVTAAQMAIGAIKWNAAYPDPHCRLLRRAIAAYYHISEDMILCGSGASGVIDSLVRAVQPDTALIPAPTFSEYEKVLIHQGCKVKFHFTKERDAFRLNADILSGITEEIRLLFLCDPNNPNGSLIDPDLLQEILVRCRQTHTLLAVDQSFLELTEADHQTLIRQLHGERGLILIRAFTKSFSMAGLRVGYCLSANRELLHKMASVSVPWSVSTPAQAAGVAALTQAPDWPRISVALIARERNRIAYALNQAGAIVYPSDANYLLFRWSDNQLKQNLLEQGILIRQCGDYRGLDDCYFRVAVRWPQDNEYLIHALRQIKR